MANEALKTAPKGAKTVETNGAIRNETVANLEKKVVTTMEKNLQSVNSVVEFSKGNFEAVIVSAKAAAEGAELITRSFVEISKKSFEDAQNALQGIMSAKTPNEAFQLQNEYAKAQFDAAVATLSKFSETFLKVAGEVTQPLSKRVGLAADNVKKAITAA